MTETITTEDGLVLAVERVPDATGLRLCLRMRSPVACVLHWGILRPDRRWEAPPPEFWPEGSERFDGSAVRTPFRHADGVSAVDFRFPEEGSFGSVAFALFFPEGARWDNNGGRNYRFELRERPSPDRLLDALRAEVRGEVVFEEAKLAGDSPVAALVLREEAGFRVRIGVRLPAAGPVILHWGLSPRSRNEWVEPPRVLWPPGTEPAAGAAARTPMAAEGSAFRVDLRIPEEEAPAGVRFVLHDPATGHWLKPADARDFFAPLVAPKPGALLGRAELEDLAGRIVEREMGPHSWTLMHRFDFCHDLLDRAGDDPEALALLFVWLRFSQLRQLDWQRNYNTKPRELGHALDRLTQKLARLYEGAPRAREWVRLLMTTLGRGADAHRVRDEVLHIMHRHGLKEVSGHFMEEWHQKLHNNTTPDDLVICEAYLAFLRSDGDLGLFYRTLEGAGVSRARLQGYERPIRSDPELVPHLKGPLIVDFEHFLGILREVHAGTDLGVAIQGARPWLSPELHADMDFVWRHRADPTLSVTALLGRVTRSRRELGERLESGATGGRELLFLDIALENLVREAIERNLERSFGVEDLLRHLSFTLENVCLSHADPELVLCLSFLRRLAEGQPRSPEAARDWLLRAEAGSERAGRGLAALLDRWYAALQPKAERLGEAFRAEAWTVSLFAEEVVRGLSAFALSALLRKLHPALREAAGLGAWQIVSRARAAGRVRVVPSLLAVQGERFPEPAVLLAEAVGGQEEIPEGTSAVVTPASVDLVSHLAIRARNAGVFFATCYDAETLSALKALEGCWVALEVTPAGEVRFGEAEERLASRSAPDSAAARAPHRRPPALTCWALPWRDFTGDLVGGKSSNLKRLRQALPQRFRVPASAALTFGAFDAVLRHPANAEAATRYRAAVERLGDAHYRAGLEELKEIVLSLVPPDALMRSLRQAMAEASLAWPRGDRDLWTCILRVWASRWNERAYLSRRALGIPHEEIDMAVLVQEVVEADYSFILHTADPSTGSRDELFGEVVLGLGETLAGNYPGFALGFTCAKQGGAPSVLRYPSKSLGLYGAGLILRSDSNAEDLAGYAGAGLYDSFLLTPPGQRTLDYTREPLTWDEGFRRELLRPLAELGGLTEAIFGSAQDVEGAIARGEYYVVQARPQVGLPDG
ncbi:MAG: hypothetical protein HY900_29865 [Deltaproteobacteria bacterium]|nr:hypothetical protein [Deltaproteobacteria bacterium]